MIKVYAVILVIGILGLLIVIFGGAFAENLGRPDRDPGDWLGIRGKMAVGAMVGFGMGGMSAEFSPLDFPWQLSLGLAVVASAISALWVRYSVRHAEG